MTVSIDRSKRLDPGPASCPSNVESHLPAPPGRCATLRRGRSGATSRDPRSKRCRIQRAG
eukprot:1928413-Pyramimonas_sp.AAC.1